MDAQNNHEKIFEPTKNPQKNHQKKSSTHEIPTRTNFGPTKARWHDGLRPTMAQNPRNLAHSLKTNVMEQKLLDTNNDVEEWRTQ